MANAGDRRPEQPPLAGEPGLPARKLSLAPGEILYRQGEDPGFVYLIDRGRVETFRELPDGSEETCGRFGAGETLGRVAPLRPPRRTESARAVQTTVLTAFEPRDLRARQIAEAESNNTQPVRESTCDTD